MWAVFTLFIWKWKWHLLGGIALVGVILGVYFKGYFDSSNRYKTKDQKQTIERLYRERKVVEKARRAYDKIRKTKEDLGRGPALDAYYSCLLSSEELDPKDCARLSPTTPSRKD